MRIYLLSLVLSLFAVAYGVTDSLLYKGQVSAYANYNPSNTMDLGTGVRLIPQFNYELQFDDQFLIDFEGSLNLYTNASFRLSDSSFFDADTKPYRLWGRYSNEQLEIRVGLQKIDFGQATMLRPLMWFDSVDPRDPLGITDGVYGALARYYFLDNTNVWMWGLLGNDGTKGLEWGETSSGTIEYGARVQSNLWSGELGLTYHHRSVDVIFGDEVATTLEQRIAFDARWDFIAGAYIEGAWVSQNANIGTLTNQTFLTLGMDYTFGLGAGFYTVLEHMIVATDESEFQFQNTASLTAFQMNYPIGMFDNLGSIIYYDWTNNDVYTFVNWFRQYDRFTFYMMAYWNPENTLMSLPGMDASQSLMSGKGFQVMVVFNF